MGSWGESKNNTVREIWIIIILNHIILQKFLLN